MVEVTNDPKRSNNVNYTSFTTITNKIWLQHLFLLAFLSLSIPHSSAFQSSNLGRDNIRTRIVTNTMKSEIMTVTTHVNNNPQKIRSRKQEQQQDRIIQLFMTKEETESSNEITKFDNANGSGGGASGGGFNNMIQKRIENFFTIEETRILAGDAVSCLLVCQLLTLLDVLHNPAYWNNVEADSFAQQALTLPSTLPTLVTRDCEVTIAWIIAALKNKSYTYAAIDSDASSIKCAFFTWVDYCSVRVLYCLLVSVVFTKLPVDGWELVRQMWITLLMLPTFRLIYSQNNR